MSKMLSNEKIINEIRQNEQDYINTRPEMIFKPFVNNRAERNYNLGDRVGGYKSLGQNPRFSASINNQTAFPDPLYGGGMYNNYLEFNKRRNGGAILSEKMPLTGGDYYSSSDSESECSSSDSECSSSDYESDDDYEGGGIYDDYVKPAGKALYDVGTEVFKDVVVPVGKEILKDAIVGLMSGAGRMKGGKITGTKDEFIHILRKINPELTQKELNKNTKEGLSRKLYDILKIGMHPKDLETLHYLDALTKNYGQSGGLSGTKKELMAIVKAMYPNIDFKKMSKKDIINEIKREQPEKEIKVKREKVVKPPKEPKKRGRPKVDKPPESKINKLLKSDKEINKMVKETKKSMVETAQLDKEFNRLMAINKKLSKKPKKQGKKPKEPKIVGTKRGERVRGEIVKRYMTEHNVSLGEASKKVKELGLY